MKNLSALVLGLGWVFAVSSSHAMDLKQSKVTQVVNDVEIISAADQSQKNASVNDVFKMPDILKTGPQSRAELVAEDETVTRVGANTIFSFDPANRTIDLKQGSLLFHSPHGKGGGTIHTGSATASVLGTTLIITTTPSGGFKVIDLEGSVEVNFLNGLSQKLAPGQMSFVLPGGNHLSPIIVFRLDDLTKNSRLVGGFHNQLASLPLILQQVQKQLAAIQSGKLSSTPFAVGSDADSQGVQVVTLDPNTLQKALNSYQNLVVASGSTIESDVANWQWDSPNILSLNTVTIINNLGNTYFTTGAGGLQFNNCSVTTLGDLGVHTLGGANFNGTSLKANSSTMNVSGSLGFSGSGVTLIAFGAFTAGKNITLSGSDFLTDPSAGALNFNAKNGSINVSGSSFNTSFLSLNASDGILLDGTGQTFTGGANAQAHFSASGPGAVVSLSNADFTHYAQTSIASDTVNLYKIAFNNIVNIFSRLGTWNNGSSQPGCVNDLGGVTYNGTLVSAANGSTGKLSGTGITIGKLP